MRRITQHTIKRIVLIGTLVGLFLPLIQMKFNLFEVDKLEGTVERKELPQMFSQEIYNGKYQEKFSAYFKNQFGFNELFIRLNNQKKFSLFGEITANGVIMGKEGYLYEENYILTHLGRDFIGEDSIKMKVSNLQKIRKKLNEMDKELLIIFAPGKGSFYPEYIPEDYILSEKSTSNYEIYSTEMNSSNLPFIDFHHYFDSLKGITEYPIFPKNGIHWSKFAEFVALDSIVNYISSEFNYSLNRFELTNIDKSSKARDSDNDLEKLLNLLIRIPGPELHYPNYQFKENSSLENSPKVLTISDSFFWGMYNLGTSEKIFNNGEFWYYNNLIYPESSQSTLLVESINFKERIDQYDVVILMCTDGNLGGFPFKFDEMMLKHYK